MGEFVLTAWVQPDPSPQNQSPETSTRETLHACGPPKPPFSSEKMGQEGEAGMVEGGSGQPCWVGGWHTE